ncbi:MAG: Flp pilus assembly complex ATPase component TadA [Candidatus Moraniibacteriota bacterium]|nr:MAG: Flp pilus assembly complex ATPase component TadA [Candidatus Moranbacteria bacterium]
MKIKNQQLKEFILDSDLVAAESLEGAFQEAERSKTSLGVVLLSKKLLSETDLQKLYAYILGIPFVDLSKEAIPTDILHIIPEPIAKKSHVVAFEKAGTNLKVAMLNPDDLQTIDFIKKKTGLKIVPCLTTEESINQVLRQYGKSLKAEFGDILNAESVVGGEFSADVDPEQNLEKVAQDIPVIRVVDTLIKHAILQSASDIHIEPEEKEVHVRYRIDGILHDAMTLPRDIAAGIVARIKVLSNLKLDEHRLPQDGRFKLESEEQRISFRVSILPVFDGEKIVMRLLDESSKGLTLEKMGFAGVPLEIVHREIKKPNGMVLVTGPTGSGKTTTLYTVMDILNTNEVNISTVEDPVEYRMPRVNQTQVNSKIGMTFAAALRALLRQDPDIVMVGEIRDEETLEIALHAAMTGHLVLSTLHTNGAAAAIPRMIDMGAEPFLIASTTNVVIAQRLVRRLCVECREEYHMKKAELATLGKTFNLEEVMVSLKREDQMKEKLSNISDWESVSFFRAKGCDQCGGEGYHGRVGIYEVFEMTSDIRRLVMESATSEALEKAARDAGMLTMVEDGFLKAILGATSVEEILRVTKE